MVIAFEAPNCTNSMGITGCSANSTYFDNFMTYLNSNVSGIALAIPWSQVDDCLASGVTGPSSPCSTQAANTDSCSTELSSVTDYKWCRVDNGLIQYINNYMVGPSFAGKKIALIIEPVSDSSPNMATPQYVFSTAWAGSATPQEVIVCKSYPGDITNMTNSCPARLSTTSFATDDFAIWNVNGTSVTPPNCVRLSGSDLTCPPTTGPNSCPAPITDFTGFPIVYETPFVNAYQDFLKAVATHYNVNTGTRNGPAIAPYIAYVRVGLAEGGENQPNCTMVSGSAPQPTTAIASPPAGYIVNVNHVDYVATGGGNRGSRMPTCSPSGCTTAPDGQIPGWYNAGPWYQGTGGTPMWPGTAGQFAPTPEPGGYTDNGYLSTWADNPGGGPGYVATMVSFLQTLGASFPFAIGAHNGPPANTSVAYADSDAIMASANGVGFGMESVSIIDGAGIVPFPTSANDWAHSFKAYPAPVHYLQTFFPGFPTHAAGYVITSASTSPSGTGITVSGGSATIACVGDCSIFTSTSSYPIYVSGASSPLLDGITPTTPCVGTCPAGYLSFTTTAPNSTSYPGGDVWAPDYWPIVMPFAVRHDATVIEVYECDLDYAFGLYPTHTTADWVTPVCVPPASSGTAGPVPGPDQGYKNTLIDTMIGQPATTSVRAGTSILNNGRQY